MIFRFSAFAAGNTQIRRRPAVPLMLNLDEVRWS
jgi:hypothetical protein